jgi:hypothetical protein
MGSWTDLDANYPPDALTPATALVVALAHIAGATHDADAAIALLPELGYIPGLRERMARYLHEVALDAFLAEAHTLLAPRQQHAIALLLHHAHRAAGAPAERTLLLEHIIHGLGVDPAELATYHDAPARTNDLELFPQ